MPEPGVYPRGAPRPTSSKAEQALHRELTKRLPKGWYAWHSLRVRAGAKFEGEGDFVIGVPGRGLLVLEVKGGAIEVRSGRWFQNGREMTEAPRDQAHRYRGKLRRKIEEGNRGSCPWVGIATAFPQTPFSNEPTEGAVAGAVLGQQDLAYLDEALVALADRLFKDTHPPRDNRWIDVVHALWCETWTPRLALGDRSRMREQELIALDAMQLKVLYSLEQNPRLLITGGPGTGKTLVARELYRRLEQAGRHPLYLCSTLALAAGLRAWGIKHAWTVRDFAARLLEQAGISVQGGAPREQWSADTWDMAPLKAAADALPELELPYDALLLDEGQDIPVDDWDLLELLAGGGVFWAFADQGQGFWTNRGVSDGLFPFTFQLRERYRCPEPLAKFADCYRPGEHELPEGPIDELRVVRVPSASALPSKVATEIQKALGGGVKHEEIAVLTLGGQSRTSLGLADRIGSHRVVRADSAEASTSIISDTFLRFKGLERPFIIVAELSAAKDHRYDVRMHIALTRATVSCVVLATGEHIDKDDRLKIIAG